MKIKKDGMHCTTLLCNRGKEKLLIVAKTTIKDLNKKVIELEAKVESCKQRVNEIVDFISERVKGFFGNILKSKYKDVADN